MDPGGGEQNPAAQIAEAEVEMAEAIERFAAQDREMRRKEAEAPATPIAAEMIARLVAGARRGSDDVLVDTVVETAGPHVVDLRSPDLPGRIALVESLKAIAPGHAAATYEREVRVAETGMELEPDYPSEAVLNVALDRLFALPTTSAPPPPPPPEEEPQLTVLEVRDRIAEMFPRVEESWVEEKWVDGQTLTDIVNMITDPNINVPLKASMRKRKSSGDVGPFRRALTYQTDAARKLGAERALRERFDNIALPSIRAVLKAFGFNFAPAYKALHDELSRPSFKSQSESGAGSVSTSQPLGLGPEEFAKRANWTQTAGVTSLKLLKRPRRVKAATAPPAPDAELEAEIAAAEAALPPFAKPVKGETPAGDGIECEVCCEERAPSAFAACRDGHIYCRECVKTAGAEAVYGQGRAEIGCLEPGCKAGYPPELLAELLSASELSALEERSGAAAVAAAGLVGFAKCRFCSWGAVLEAPPEVDKVFNCGGCGAATCRLCERDWDDEHIGRKCEELETDGATAARKRLEEDLSKAVLRRCHKCSLQFQKVEGCNKMTCSCKATSCYLCRKPDIDYNHFCRHPLNPGESCPTCKFCKLFEDPKYIDSQRLQAVYQSSEAEKSAA